MRNPSFFSVVKSDRTFLLALGFVALFGVVQLGAVAFHYARSTHSAPVLGQPSIAVPPDHLRSTSNSPAVVPESLPTTAATNPSAADVSNADRLLGEARNLRERGDTMGALAKLQEALQSDPKNAGVLTEMAMLYESVKLYDRSSETWRRVQDLGASAGPLYELADLKLKFGVATGSASSPSPNTAAVNTDGIADGSNFGITELTATQGNDADAETHITLRVAVKARADAPIDFTRVKIQVFFYDAVEGGQIVLTDADVSYEWLTPHHDWKDVNPEILAVTYLRPKKDGLLSSDASLSAAAAEVVPPVPGRRSQASKSGSPPPSESSDGPHKYYGYIVRVYYRDQLQAVRAEPSRLLSLFPPPYAAPQQ